MSTITIFHNPSCGTSRNTLALIRHAGLEPTVVEYLKTPLSTDELGALVKQLGIPVRGLVREKESRFAELGLGEPGCTDEQLLEAMAANPVLMNRPVVVTPLGASLCRPSEAVLSLLPVGAIAPFTKEDGEQVVDSGVRRGA